MYKYICGLSCLTIREKYRPLLVLLVVLFKVDPNISRTNREMLIGRSFLISSKSQ